MPLVESAGPGLTPGPLAFSAPASCRKEKKKQAKEERDRLKQAEKKKRRLEKALATAAAIRAELEKKKQRRKEEERRLDEEGAALAEAVALQVGNTCLHHGCCTQELSFCGALTEVQSARELIW
jgi:hypothetical protein